MKVSLGSSFSHNLQPFMSRLAQAKCPSPRSVVSALGSGILHSLSSWLLSGPRGSQGCVSDPRLTSL